MTNSPKPNRVASPWARAVILLAVLIAAAFAFPGGMVDWLGERNESGWLSAPLAVARTVDAVSSALRVKQVGQGLRRAFGDWVGADST